MKKLFQVPSSKFQVQSLRFKDLEPGTWNVEHGARNPEPGTWNLEHAATVWALGAVLALMPAVASAQITTDPTRPATGFAADAPEGAAGNQLQSVMISPTRSAAIINGVTVRLGEKYGDAVLVRVAESEVVLRSGGDQQVLKIHPGVDKREIVPVSVAAPAAAKSAPRKAKAKAKPKAKPQRGAKPAADSGAGTR
jgi:MSHA biogenesis protein MshK